MPEMPKAPEPPEPERSPQTTPEGRWLHTRAYFEALRTMPDRDLVARAGQPGDVSVRDALEELLARLTRAKAEVRSRQTALDATVATLSELASEVEARTAAVLKPKPKRKDA